MSLKILLGLLFCLYMAVHVNGALKKIGTADGFEFYMDSDITRDWQGAKDYCKANKMYLASLDSADKDKLVSDYMEPTLGRSGTAWAGGRYQRDDKFWYWDTSGQKFSFTHWHFGLGSPPIIPVEGRYCVQLYNSNQGYAWTPSECEDKKHIVCQG